MLFYNAQAENCFKKIKAFAQTIFLCQRPLVVDSPVRVYALHLSHSVHVLRISRRVEAKVFAATNQYVEVIMVVMVETR